MSQKRIDRILDIIKEQGYVTVKYLCEELHYSTATINRDLNDLQKQKLIVRHYGGAELATRKGVPLIFRYHKMRPVKRVISKKAAELISDGMTVFIDGCTTTQYMAEYIGNIKDLTVITNNLNLVSHLSEAGVKCICLGGTVVEVPYMTGGEDTVLQAKTYTADLAFFSTAGVSADGSISESNAYFGLHRAMLEQAKKSIFLVDHQKIGIVRKRILCDFSKIDTVISDFEFSDRVKETFADTRFITVKTPKTQQ